MCYHAGMKKLNPSRLCGVYLVLMSSVFPLAFTPAGYLNIAETKLAVFCFLSGGFLLLFLLLRLRGPLEGRLSWDPIRALVLAYWAWSLFSALLSPWPRTALLGGDRFDGMITMTLYVAVFLLLSLYGGLEHFPVWLPAAALSVLCVTAILQLFDLNPFRLYPGELRWSGRETEYNGAFLSLTGNADLTASVLCTGFGLLWPLGMQRGRRWLWLPAAACLGVLAASGIRSGILGAAASLLLYLPSCLPLEKKTKRRVYAGLLLLCFLCLLLVYLVPLPGTAGELHAVLRGHADDSFGSGRIYIWRNVWQLVKERPILGGGPDTLGERGLAFVRTAPDGSAIRRTIDCAHSEPLNILVNQGAPALLLLTAAMLLTLIRSFHCKGAAVPALRSALISYGIASLFGIAMPANSAFAWLLLGMLLAEIGKTAVNQ